jgi:hypothetical protein
LEVNFLIGIVMAYLALGITAWTVVWSDPKGEARTAAAEAGIHGVNLVLCALAIIVIAPAAIFLGLLHPEEK